jgi:hypothetical protein
MARSFYPAVAIPEPFLHGKQIGSGDMLYGRI